MNTAKDESSTFRVVVAGAGIGGLFMAEKLKRAALPGTVWVGCKNWYSDQEDTPILWPLPQDEHTALLADIAVEELQFIPVTDS